MINEKIKLELIKATYDRDEVKKSILRVVLGEISRIITKLPTDSNDFKQYKETGFLSNEHVIKILLKLEKDLLQINSKESLEELKIISEFLPKKLSEEEIKSAIMSIVLSNEGLSFKELKTLFDLNYPYQDGKIVSKYIKELK